MLDQINYFDADHMIVYGFLAVILFVGLYVGRNIKDMKDYAIANKSYRTTTLVLTFLATGVGAGSTLGTCADVFADGLIMLLVCFGTVPAVLFIVYFIVPRMVDPGESISMADLMGKFYGTNTQIFTGIIGTAYSVGLVAAQTLALGFVFEALLGVGKGMGIGIGGAIMVLYAAFGGIRSVTITDIIQFSVLIVIVPLISGAATNHAGGIAEIFASIPAEKCLIWEHEKFNYYLVLFLLYAIPALSMDPARVQRMLMAKDKQQITRMFLTDLQVAIPFNFMIALIGFSAVVLYPALSPREVFPHIVRETMPGVLQGISVAGIMAVIMSTADSCLNSGSIMFVHDVLKPIFQRRNVHFNELQWVKYATLILGAGAMFLAYHSDNIIKVIFYAISLYAPLITIPFVAGLIGMKVDARTFVVALFAALATYIVSKLSLAVGMDDLAVLLSVFANAITFFTMHYVRNGGFAFLPREGVVEDVSAQSSEAPPARTRRPWRRYLPTIQNIAQFSQARVSKYGTDHVMFAAFFCLNYILPYFMWSAGRIDSYTTLMIVRFVGALLCVPLLVREYWPWMLHRYFPAYWHLAVLYALPFSTTVSFLLMGGTTEGLINIALATMIMIAVVDWLTFIILSLIGVGMGVILYLALYSAWSDIPSFSPDVMTMHQLFYTCLFSTLIGLIFFRRREKEVDKQLQSLELFGKAVAHEVRNVAGLSKAYASSIRFFFDQMRVEKTVPATDDNRETLYLKMDKLAHESLVNTVDDLMLDSDHGIVIINRMLASMRRTISTEDFAVCSMRDCITRALLSYGLSERQKNNIKVSLENDFLFRGSEYYMQHIIYNLLKNSHKYGRDDCRIEIWLKNNRLHFKDDGPGIAPHTLPNIFDHFFTTSKTGTGIGLAFCRLVMDEFGGSIICKSRQGPDSFTEFLLGFPPVDAQEPTS